MSSNRPGSGQDLYELLRCDRTATPDEVRRAFRREGAKCHPDRNPNDPRAEARFKAMNEAYQVLNDPARRDFTTGSV